MPAPDNPFGLKPAPKFTDLIKPMELIDDAQNSRMEKLAQQLGSATGWTPKQLGLEAHWRKAMEPYINPMSSAGLLGSTFQKLLDDQAKSMQEFSRRFQEINAPAKDALDQITRSFAGRMDFGKSFVSDEANRIIQESMRMPKVYDDFRSTLEKLHEKYTVGTDVSRLIAQLEQASREVSSLRDGGIDGVGDQQRLGAAKKFEALVEATSEAQSASAQLETIVAAINATQDTIQQKLLWLLLAPVLIALLFSLLNPVMDFYVKKRLEEASSRQEANKVVKQEVREAVPDPRMLVDYRFVSMPKGKVLTVRASPGARAPRVGELRTGQVVHVVERSDAFALVEWRSEDSTAAVKGWVFARYLERFQ